MNKNNGGRGRPAQITKEQAIQLEKRRIAEIKRRKERKAAFDKVVAVSNRTLKVGKPYVKDAFVKGTVLKNGKGKKITVFTYKPKKGSSRKIGHRQPYTKVQITEIG